MSVAVVVPVHRNAATLDPLRARLAAAMTEPWTLHLVVDACPEGSALEARRLAAADPWVHVTVLSRNVGQHRALATGLAAEDHASAWVCLDGDLQDPPEAIPALLAVLRQQRHSAVFAGRRGAYESIGRRLTGTAHRRALLALTGLPADAGAFFAMDRRVRDGVVDGVLGRDAPSVVVAAGRSGAPVTSIPVVRELRAVGTSSWSSSARLRQSVQTLAWAARHRPSRGVDSAGAAR